ncbi:hypothetical protein DFJ58DRAFT_739326 [Suillus subalutaceus]|uniref:uncharacterized protein n=1 Tax=Suillus subalutaceus TaxID=48586 RepID=UPI001B872962|nr:uncharacterized protein DFJ58DRAFT_739326 [Suillus subalutaceus]KAG1820072.1 hypothetical protein DFJ58DRAFT_739326 [Suillus subalutaceus]
MSSFNFSEVVNPNVDQLQRAFADLRLRMRKEEWLRDWNQLMRELSSNALDCKTYNMSLALSSEEGAMGRKAEDAHKTYSAQVHAYKLEVQHLVDEQAALELAEREKSREKEQEQEKGKEKAIETDVTMGRELEEEEAPVRPLRVIITKRAKTTGAMAGRGRSLKASRTAVSIAHAKPCTRCLKAEKPCVGKPNTACDSCKDSRKKCDYSTHRRGVVKERAAARAIAVAKVPSAPAAGTSGAGVLIRCPRTTPEDVTVSSDEGEGEEEEEEAEEEEEEESVEESRKQKLEGINVDFDPLVDVDAADEDILLESKVRMLYARMLTMHGMLLEMMTEVDSLAVRCKKRRRLL